MSKVNLKDGVVFNVESCDFSLEFNGKEFTSKTFDGAIKQKEEHEKMLEGREIFKEDLVEVVNIATNKTFLYHLEKKHLYERNKHGFLERYQHDNYRSRVSSFSYLYCERSKLNLVSEIMQERVELEEELAGIQQDLTINNLKLEGVCIGVKNYKG
jgi:hypothetical protein